MSNSHQFVIADTHFGHRRIVDAATDFRRDFATIEEHDEELVRRWNDTVRPKDTVWHLGDVLFGRHSFAILPRLNGIKKLVMGNHDQYPLELYQQHFAKIFGAVKHMGCIFTHIPIHPSEFYRWKANVHGHLHSKTVPDDARYINVSAEQTNLTPVRLDLLLKERGVL